MSNTFPKMKRQKNFLQLNMLLAQLWHLVIIPILPVHCMTPEQHSPLLEQGEFSVVQVGPVGARVGPAEGAKEGRALAVAVGIDEGGLVLGDDEGAWDSAIIIGIPDGMEDGIIVGESVGAPLTVGVEDGAGKAVGTVEGVDDGIELGMPEGMPEGWPEGWPEGMPEGAMLIMGGFEGMTVGSIEGISDVAGVGSTVFCASTAQANNRTSRENFMMRWEGKKSC
jgi:hypothetical protein